MRRIFLVALALIFPASAFAGGMLTFDNQPKFQQQARVGLSDKLNQLGSRVLPRLRRPVISSASLSYEAKADLVTIVIGITGFGKTVGEAVEDLSRKKANLVSTNKERNIDIAKTELTAISVRAQRSRRYSEGNNAPFRGTASLIISFPIGDDVLKTIATISGDKVDQISRMNYSYSEKNWNSIVADIKAKLKARAEKRAQTRAQMRGRTISKLVPTRVHIPVRSKYQRQQNRTFRASASYSVIYE